MWKGLVVALISWHYRFRRSLFLFSNPTWSSKSRTSDSAPTESPVMDTHLSRSTSICVGSMRNITYERPSAASTPVSLLTALLHKFSHSVCQRFTIGTVTARTGRCVWNAAPLSSVAPRRLISKKSAVCITEPSAHFNCAVLSSCTCYLSSVW